MQHKSISIWSNRFTALALLAALLASLVQVTPAYAASIVVNSVADTEANDGLCTLREAILAAINDARSGTALGECAAGSITGVDSITFAATLPAPVTITVGSQLPFISNPPAKLSNSVTIQGNGAVNTIIQSSPCNPVTLPNGCTPAEWRVFQVTPTGNLTLDGVTVQNGRCNGSCTIIANPPIDPNAGGAIHNTGTVTVRNSTIRGNTGILGGGIYNAGTLVVENSTFEGNHASQKSGSDDGGGAIYNSGTLNVINSTFSTNSAEKNGGAIFNPVGGVLNVTNGTFSGNEGSLGGGIFNNGGAMTVTNSTFTSNNARLTIATPGNDDADGGGAIRNTGELKVLVTGSTFSSNTAQYAGGIANFGTLEVTNSIFSGNEATRKGGAIFNSGNLTITDSTLSENKSTSPQNDFGGGAIFNQTGGVLTITNSTLSGNTSTFFSGAIDNFGGITIINSTISENKAGDVTFGEAGVAFNNSGSTLTVINSTITGNQAKNGGGIINQGTLNITNSTLANNSSSNASFGGGITNRAGGSTTLKNTILANNPGGNCVDPVPVVNGGNNLQFGGGVANSCGAGIPTANPQLGALANNGGLTQTMKLLAGSPAIDAGDAATCPGTDQRGEIRPQGAGCDIGAFETSNGAGRDTVGVFRPSDGLLYLKNSNTTGFADYALNYGLGGDYPIVGDWDGDGTVTIGIYRGNTFYLRNENTIGFATIVFDFGQVGDQPIAGDWDGDGDTTIGVFRPSTAQFFLRNSNDTGDADITFYLGNPGDVGIAGDWNGDGMDTTGVFRPSDGVIFLKDTNDTGIADYALNYGIPGDKPVMGDWNFDGIDTIGILRGNVFYLRNSNTNGFAEMVFALGIPGDMPIAGNWDAQP